MTLVAKIMEEDLSQRLSKIEETLHSLAERNKRVELDKAWELSNMRRFSILVMTYALTSLVFYLLGAKHVFTSAVVPTLGYYLSIQSLPVLKRWWIDRHNLNM